MPVILRYCAALVMKCAGQMRSCWAFVSVHCLQQQQQAHKRPLIFNSLLMLGLKKPLQTVAKLYHDQLRTTHSAALAAHQLTAGIRAALTQQPSRPRLADESPLEALASRATVKLPNANTGYRWPCNNVNGHIEVACFGSHCDWEVTAR